MTIDSLLKYLEDNQWEPTAAEGEEDENLFQNGGGEAYIWYRKNNITLEINYNATLIVQSMTARSIDFVIQGDPWISSDGKTLYITSIVAVDGEVQQREVNQ